MNRFDCVLVLTAVLLSAVGEVDGGEIVEAEEDPRVKYEVLKESKLCKGTLKRRYVGFMDFIGKYQDTNEIFLNSTEYAIKQGDTPDGDDSNLIKFNMTVGNVTEGLRIGLKGQCNNEVRKIWVPKELVAEGHGIFSEENIPRGRDLVFEVYMFNIFPESSIGMQNMFKVYDTDGDGYMTKQEIGEYLVDVEKMPSNPSVVKLINRALRRDDKDEDGKISFNEFRGPKWDSHGIREHDEL